MSVRASTPVSPARLLRAHVGRRARPPARSRSAARRSPASARAMPKSATSVLPSRVSRMFSGLMSRWIDAVLVGVLERLRRLARDPERVLHRELPLAPEPVAQALALDVRHGEPEPCPPASPESSTVRMCGMLQPGGEADLALEALGAERGGQLGVEHLERDRPVVPEVAGRDRPWPCRRGRARARARSGPAALRAGRRWGRSWGSF